MGESFNVPLENQARQVSNGALDEVHQLRGDRSSCDVRRDNAARSYPPFQPALPRYEIPSGPGCPPIFPPVGPGPAGEIPMPPGSPCPPARHNGRGKYGLGEGVPPLIPVPPIGPATGSEIPMPPGSPCPPARHYGRGNYGLGEGVPPLIPPTPDAGYGVPPVIPPGPGGEYQHRFKGGRVFGQGGSGRAAEIYEKPQQPKASDSVTSPEALAKQIVATSEIPATLQLSTDKKYGEEAGKYIQAVQEKLKGTGYELEKQTIGGTDVLVLKYDKLVTDINYPAATHVEHSTHQALEHLWKEGRLPKTREDIKIDEMRALILHYSQEKPSLEQLTGYLKARETEAKLAKELIDTGEVSAALREALRNPDSQVRHWSMNVLLRGSEMQLEESRVGPNSKYFNYHLVGPYRQIKSIVDWM